MFSERKRAASMSKAKSKASSKGEEGISCRGLTEEKRLLCCVPNDVVECLQVIGEPETAVKMGCSNLQCKSHRLVHQKCFEKLEKHLVTATQRLMPKSRKLNEAQLKANIWDIRGQDVLKKMCKCSCGGTLRKEEEVDVPLPMPVVQRKEKASPKKPKLNCLPGRISEQSTFLKKGYEASQKKIVFAKHDDQSLSKLKPARAESPPSSAKPDHHQPYKSRQPLLKTNLPLLKSDLPPNQRSKIVPFGSRLLEDPTKKVFVYHLPKGCSEEDLSERFEEFGEVVDIWISAPPSTYAFVLFKSADSVEKVMASLPIIIFGSFELRVQRKKGSEESEGNNNLLAKQEAKGRSEEGRGNTTGGNVNILADAILLSNRKSPLQADTRKAEPPRKTNPTTAPESKYIPKCPEDTGPDSFFSQREAAEKGLLDRETECPTQEKENSTDVYWSDGEDRLDRRPDEKDKLRIEAENQALQGGMEMVKELLRLKEANEADRLRLEAENQALREALSMSEKISEGRRKIIETMYAQVAVLKSYLGEASVYGEKTGTKPKNLGSGSSTPENWERSN